MQAAIAWLEGHADCRKVLLICDCKSLVDAVCNPLSPEEGIMLMRAVVARLNAERCLVILWVPGHCGLRGNELADEEVKPDSAKHHPPVPLDCATRRAIILHACLTPFISTPLHTTTCPINLNHRDDIQMSKPNMTYL